MVDGLTIKAYPGTRIKPIVMLIASFGVAAEAVAAPSRAAPIAGDDAVVSGEVDGEGQGERAARAR